MVSHATHQPVHQPRHERQEPQGPPTLDQLKHSQQQSYDKMFSESLAASRKMVHGKNLVSPNEAARRIAEQIDHKLAREKGDSKSIGSALESLDKLGQHGWSHTAQKVRDNLAKDHEMMARLGFPAASQILPGGHGQVKLRTKDGTEEIRDRDGKVLHSQSKPEAVAGSGGKIERSYEHGTDPRTGQAFSAIESRFPSPDGKHEGFNKRFFDPKDNNNGAVKPIGQWNYTGMDGKEHTIDGVKSVEKSWNEKTKEYDWRVHAAAGETKFSTNEAGRMTHSDMAPDKDGLQVHEKRNKDGRTSQTTDAGGRIVGTSEHFDRAKEINIKDPATGQDVKAKVTGSYTKYDASGHPVSTVYSTAGGGQIRQEHFTGQDGKAEPLKNLSAGQLAWGAQIARGKGPEKEDAKTIAARAELTKKVYRDHPRHQSESSTDYFKRMTDEMHKAGVF